MSDKLENLTGVRRAKDKRNNVYIGRSVLYLRFDILEPLQSPLMQLLINKHFFFVRVIQESRGISTMSKIMPPSLFYNYLSIYHKYLVSDIKYKFSNVYLSA